MYPCGQRRAETASNVTARVRTWRRAVRTVHRFCLWTHGTGHAGALLSWWAYVRHCLQPRSAAAATSVRTIHILESAGARADPAVMAADAHTRHCATHTEIWPPSMSAAAAPAASMHGGKLTTDTQDAGRRTASGEPLAQRCWCRLPERSPHNAGLQALANADRSCECAAAF